MTDQESNSQPGDCDVQSTDSASSHIENSQPDGADVQTPQPALAPADAPSTPQIVPAAETLPPVAEELPPPAQAAVEAPAGQPPAPEQMPEDQGKAEEHSPEETTPAEPPAMPKAQPHRNQPEQPTAVVRYGLNRHLGEFRYNPSKIRPVPSQKVVIRTERGVEMGTVVAPVVPTSKDKKAETPSGCGGGCGGECGGGCGGSSTKHNPMAIDADRLRKFLKTEGNDYPFRRGGRLLRAANPQDLIDYRHFKKSSAEASQYCKQQIAEQKLPMRLVSVEHLIGGERIIFYFNSEDRVDFRVLVKDLASRFRTRIEMRQVGARDEARIVADYERCGQRCCCQQYLKLLKPVSMRMAKVQKATLDPSKISGRCGRLMCCLRYEDETYSTLKKNIPRKSSWIRTESLLGRVIDSQILTQLTRVSLADRTIAVIPIPDIIERDLPEPSEDDLNNAVRDMNRARRDAQSAAAGTYQPPPPSEPAPKRQDTKRPAPQQRRQGQAKATPSGANGQKSEGGKRRRRRPRRGTKPGAPQATNQPKPQGGESKPAGPSAGGGEPSAPGGEQPKRLVKRRRRRRRKPSSGGQGQTGAPPAPKSD